jgi:hypothetical protein
MYIQCIYGIFGREITKYTIIYGVDIRFWPTLHTSDTFPAFSCTLQQLTLRASLLFSCTFDALVRASLLVSCTFDALVRASLLVSCAFDAFVRASLLVSCTFSDLVRASLLVSCTFDALVRASLLVSCTFDHQIYLLFDIKDSKARGGGWSCVNPSDHRYNLG